MSFPPRTAKGLKATDTIGVHIACPLELGTSNGRWALFLAAPTGFFQTISV